MFDDNPRKKQAKTAIQYELIYTRLKTKLQEEIMRLHSKGTENAYRKMSVLAEVLAEMERLERE